VFKRLPVTTSSLARYGLLLREVNVGPPFATIVAEAGILNPRQRVGRSEQ
jgi:hypothetical protein